MKIKDIKESREKELRYQKGEMKSFEKFNYQLELIFDNYNESLENIESHNKDLIYKIFKMTPKRLYTILALLVMLLSFGSFKLLTNDTNEDVVFIPTENMYLYSYNSDDIYYDKLYEYISYSKDEVFKKITEIYNGAISEAQFNTVIKTKESFLDAIKNDNSIVSKALSNPQILLDLSLPLEDISTYSTFELLHLESIESFVLNNYEISKDTYINYLKDEEEFNNAYENDKKFKKTIDEITSNSEFQKILTNLNTNTSSYVVENEEGNSIYFLDTAHIKDSEKKILDAQGVTESLLVDNPGFIAAIKNEKGSASNYSIYKNEDISIEMAEKVSQTFELYSLNDSVNADENFYKDELILYTNVNELSNKYLSVLFESIYNDTLYHDKEYKLVFTNDKNDITVNDNNILGKAILENIKVDDSRMIKFNKKGTDLEKDKDLRPVLFIINSWKYKNGQEISEEDYDKLNEHLLLLINFFNTNNPKGKVNVTSDSLSIFNLKLKEAEEEDNISTDDLNTTSED